MPFKLPTQGGPGYHESSGFCSPYWAARAAISSGDGNGIVQK